MTWQYFYEILQSPNTNLALFLQSPNAILTLILQSPNTNLTLFLQSPNAILALILQSPNAILATISKSFLKSQYYFGNYSQKFYINLKAQLCWHYCF